MVALECNNLLTNNWGVAVPIVVHSPVVNSSQKVCTFSKLIAMRAPSPAYRIMAVARRLAYQTASTQREMQQKRTQCLQRSQSLIALLPRAAQSD